MPTTVAVLGRFSPDPDATLLAVARALVAAGARVLALDIAAIVRGDAWLSPREGRAQVGACDVAIADLDALVLGPLPSAYARTAEGSVRITAAEHDHLQKAQAGRASLAWSIALLTEARGVPVLSSPTRARPFDHKPFQLAALAAAGLCVPDTIATAGVSAAGDAERKDDDRLEKPIVGGPVTRAGTASSVPRLTQPRLRGQHARVAVVGDDVVAAATVDLADDELDSRCARAPLLPLALHHPACEAARVAARTCAYDVAAVDLINPLDGSPPVVLDVNRTPQLLDLADACGVDVAAAIGSFVMRRAKRRR